MPQLSAMARDMVGPAPLNRPKKPSSRTILQRGQQHQQQLQQQLHQQQQQHNPTEGEATAAAAAAAAVAPATMWRGRRWRLQQQ